MATDLAVIHDHPATLLSQQASLGSDTYADGMATAASFLRGYERTGGVTFAALDNDALSAVKEAWEALGPSAFLSPVSDLHSAVQALLGLGDD